HTPHNLLAILESCSYDINFAHNTRIQLIRNRIIDTWSINNYCHCEGSNDERLVYMADEYNQLVQHIRQKLLHLATESPDKYTTVLMQGSGTFSVESVIGTTIPENGKLLVVANGAYGERIATISNKLMIDTVVLNSGETSHSDLHLLNKKLEEDQDITHVAVVHCETTTGMLNPLEAISNIVKKHNKIFILDAMSSFGGIEMDIDKLRIDYLISSAN